MDNKKGIYWLASYPKSGNTWMRSFIQGLENLQKTEKKGDLYKNDDDELPLTEDGLIDINSMTTGFIASSRGMVQQILGFDVSDMSKDEVDYLRGDAYRWHQDTVTKLQYHKIHDAYVYLRNGQPMIPLQSCVGVLYIVRNPFDVAISYANHNSISLDNSIAALNDPKNSLADPQFTINNQFRQYLYSWSEHVQSWLNAPGLNIKCVRYEDMKLYPEQTFLDVAKFLQISDNIESVKAVLEEIRIDKLQKQEAQKGFMERAAFSKVFFRKGIVGDWEQTLSEKQVENIIQFHGGLMQELGYLDDSLQPTDLIRLK